VRKVPRRRVYAMGVGFYLLAAVFGVAGGRATTLALLCHAVAAAHIFVCFNAYVLDSIPKTDFGRLESLRLLYGGIGWTVGPVLGVWLLRLWHGAPFVLVALAALTMLAAFWWTGVSGNRVSTAGLQQSPQPAGLPRALPCAAPAGGRLAVRAAALLRLVGVRRLCGHLRGAEGPGGPGGRHGHVAGQRGRLLCTADAALDAAALGAPCGADRLPDVRAAVPGRGAGSPWPWLAVALMLLGACYLVLLDICGGLPFMMSVKPSQRTEMSAVYSTFRDVSGILGPAVAWVVLQFAPVAGVFAAAGLALLGAWLMAGQLHPQLGMPGAQRARLRRAGRAGPA
jgi:ACDE family multidrug resistance protein